MRFVVATNLIGNDAFQEADVVGITRPRNTYNYLVRDVNELATIVKEAFYLARSGRPGPVLIDCRKTCRRIRAYSRTRAASTFRRTSRARAAIPCRCAARSS